MESALIGLAGVVLGALLSEYFRRKNRIEIYSQKVFDKRLAIHEDLYAMFVSGHDVVLDVMTNTELSKSEREDLTSSIIFPLCQFMDRNGFYLNDYLTVQVATAYMGAEDVLDNDSDLDIASARARVYELSKITKKMILEESGVTEAFKHFSVISKSKPDSDVIKRVKELEKARV